MWTPDSVRRLKHSAAFSYGAAVLSVIVALLAARLLDIQYGYEPLSPFFCAVLFSAWIGGAKPGALALVLSLAAFHYYLLIPRHPLDAQMNLSRLILAALTGLFIVSLGAKQRSAVAALRESELRLRQIAENIRECIWIATPAMDQVLYVNPAYTRIWGRSVESLYQRPNSLFESIHAEDRKQATGIITGQRQQGFDIEYRIVRPDGAERWIRDVGFPVKNESGKIYRIAGLSEDITERRQAEDALRDSSIQLRALSRRLVELQESERRQLSRELHDRVGQNLTALKINIDVLQPALASHGDEDVLARVADSAALLESTMDAIENVMSELRPPMLDDHGLAAALDWHARRFSRRTGIAVVVHAGEPAMQTAPQVQIALFRIAQEALNNIAKHAGARHAEIALDQESGECVMSVRDDGIGFDVGKNASDKLKTGLGMVTMRERSQAVGGRFEVQALPEFGTRLTVRVPC